MVLLILRPEMRCMAVFMAFSPGDSAQLLLRPWSFGSSGWILEGREFQGYHGKLPIHNSANGGKVIEWELSKHVWWHRRVIWISLTCPLYISLWDPKKKPPEFTRRGAIQWCLSFFILKYVYPLVNIAVENGHRNSGFTHWTWWIFP